MRKLCHLFFDEYPKDSRIRRYTNALLNEGFQVTVVCLRGEAEKSFEKKGNLSIYRIPMSKKRGSFLSRLWEYIIFQIYSTILVSYLMITKRIDIFHVHTLPDFLVLACIVPKILGAKIILDFHELFPEFMLQHKPSLENSVVLKILKLQEKISFNFANEIITFHDPAREILLSRIKTTKNPTVVMNGVDESELPEVAREYIKKRELQLQSGSTFNNLTEVTDLENSNDFRITYNGTINFNLNLSLVIKAISRIREIRPEIYRNIGFHLYGDGPDLNTILDLAKELKIENVIYHGRLKYADMVAELVKSSLCVLPPKKDVYSELYYSLKLTEMIYFKIPVVATRLKTYLRYFPESSIVYFNSEDVEDLAGKIIYVYENRNEVSNFAENAYLEYQKYNWELMKGRYINLIRKLTN